ncbi:PhzF family phenazine biosynthesis protein [Arcobacter roscoffensis]|uniref:PhzF family phenazine biosynthesis protein n=1 Tax=Arcobacter roscoffensis TaxID=2961520 RepID=A0ABY5E955_9BACT|nr:PhzF family phenazine biosynthesis protein [Arcobacter roscoffensis]UTJ07265.1 PhzF family phenazine biosynthesis protein [Arcobacter roscoffensis]
MNVEKISAFSYKNKGGNPAGVLFCEEMLTDKQMLEIAKEVNFSETAFLIKENNSFRIRYFSPETEIAFCGHATIASGYSIGEKYGFGTYNLILNNGTIKIEVGEKNGESFTSINSIETHSKDLAKEYIDKVLDGFSLKKDDLDERFPIKVSFSGNNHLIIFVKERKTLKEMKYDFSKIKTLMEKEKIVTVSILWQENENLYHSRNAFAYGGVYEDPATGSAAIALAEYLRDIGLKTSGDIEILQGFDMNQPSQLFVSFNSIPNSSIKVSGTSRLIQE